MKMIPYFMVGGSILEIIITLSTGDFTSAFGWFCSATGWLTVAIIELNKRY